MDQAVTDAWARERHRDNRPALNAITKLAETGEENWPRSLSSSMVGAVVAIAEVGFAEASYDKIRAAMKVMGEFPRQTIGAIDEIRQDHPQIADGIIDHMVREGIPTPQTVYDDARVTMQFLRLVAARRVR